MKSEVGRMRELKIKVDEALLYDNLKFLLKGSYNKHDEKNLKPVGHMEEFSSKSHVGKGVQIKISCQSLIFHCNVWSSRNEGIPDSTLWSRKYDLLLLRKNQKIHFSPYDI